MPRRIAADTLTEAVGRRIRELRQQEGLTIQQLAESSEIGSKGHLSNIEHGLVRPNIYTVKQVADGLGVLPLDLLTFPEKSLRERLIEFTRTLSRRGLAAALRCIRDGHSPRR